MFERMKSVFRYKFVLGLSVLIAVTVVAGITVFAFADNKDAPELLKVPKISTIDIRPESMIDKEKIYCYLSGQNENDEGNETLQESLIKYDDAVIAFANVEYVKEVRTEQLPFEILENNVDTIPKGTKQITTEGKEGIVERSYIVKYVDGKKTEQALAHEDVVSLPTSQIVDVGVGGTVTAEDGTVYNYSYRIPMEATAYTYVPGKTTMTTATGERLRKGIVATDPKVIPMHTKVFVKGTIEYGLAVAEDVGGGIKGNKIDLAYMSYDECIQFGRRKVMVYILE